MSARLYRPSLLPMQQAHGEADEVDIIEVIGGVVLRGVEGVIAEEGDTAGDVIDALEGDAIVEADDGDLAVEDVILIFDDAYVYSKAAAQTSSVRYIPSVWRS